MGIGSLGDFDLGLQAERRAPERQALGRDVDQRVHVARRLAVVTEDHGAARAERGDAVLDERRAGRSALPPLSRLAGFW